MANDEASSEAVTSLVGTFVRYEAPHIHVVVRRTPEPPLTGLSGEEVRVEVSDSIHVGWFIKKGLELPASFATIPPGSICTFTIEGDERQIVASEMSVSITGS